MPLKNLNKKKQLKKTVNNKFIKNVPKRMQQPKITKHKHQIFTFTHYVNKEHNLVCVKVIIVLLVHLL